MSAHIMQLQTPKCVHAVIGASWTPGVQTGHTHKCTYYANSSLPCECKQTQVRPGPVCAPQKCTYVMQTPVSHVCLRCILDAWCTHNGHACIHHANCNLPYSWAYSHWPRVCVLDAWHAHTGHFMSAHIMQIQSTMCVHTVMCASWTPGAHTVNPHKCTHYSNSSLPLAPCVSYKHLISAHGLSYVCLKPWVESVHPGCPAHPNWPSAFRCTVSHVCVQTITGVSWTPGAHTPGASQVHIYYENSSLPLCV
jgi:hypothetical protein